MVQKEKKMDMLQTAFFHSPKPPLWLRGLSNIEVLERLWITFNKNIKEARGKGNIISYSYFISSMTKILFDSEHYSISIVIWHSLMSLILNFDSWLAGVRKLYVQKLRNVIITSVYTILFQPFDVMSTQRLKLYDPIRFSYCNMCLY